MNINRRQLLKNTLTVCSPVVVTLAGNSARAQGSWSSNNSTYEVPGSYYWRTRKFHDLELQRAELTGYRQINIE